MLDRLRRATAHWMARILIGLLALSFAFWGVGDLVAPSRDPAIAEVGDAVIPQTVFQRSLNILRENLRQQGRALAFDEIRQLGLDRQVLNLLTRQEALSLGAAALGLDISDRRIAEEIRDDPAFQGPFGGFDRQTFRVILAEAGLSEQRFAEERRKVHLRRQLAATVLASPPASDILARALIKHSLEKRILEYALLPISLAPKPKSPNDETLKKFLTREPSLFIRPERRDILLLELKPEHFFSSLAVSEDEIRADYDERRMSFRTPEKREVEQIIFASRDEADAAHARLKKGVSFAAIAGEKGLSEEDRNLGLLSEREFLSPSLAEAAFALKKGEVSAVVEGPLGPVLLRVAKIARGEERSLASVRDRVKRDILRRKSAGEMETMRNIVEDALAGGASLREAASDHSLPILELKGVSADGASAKGAKLPEREGLLAAAFAAAEHEESAAREMEEGGYFWLEVEKIHPSRIPSFDEIRDEARKIWRKETRRLALIRLAADLAERGNGGEDLRDLLKKYDRAPLKTPEIGRFFRSDVFSAELVEAAFARPEGRFVAGSAEIGDSVVLVRTAKIVKPSPSREEESAFRDALGARLANEFLEQYVVFLLERYGVVVHGDVLESAVLSGGGGLLAP